MSFTTLSFLLFLLAVWALYWGLRGRTAQNALLVVASYVFYGWWDWRFCSLMLLSSAVDYGVGLKLQQTSALDARRVLLGVSLITNLGVLGFFKYFGFFVDSLVDLGAVLGVTLHAPTLQVVLPVGISFYTFQTLSYTIDVYRRKLEPTSSAVDFFAFVSFFPQLVAGPIERGTRLLPQFTRPRVFDATLARDGARQMLWGVVKKLVVADNLAVLVDRAYADPAHTPGPLLAYGTLCFAFQIYADFSAYSDIAIGCARLFGFDLCRNFAFPYFSRSLDEFWRRWHISLSTWFRDYVYVPLGGNRVSPARQALNLWLTFVVSGLWHGASWNFVIWGAIHGLAVIPYTLVRRGERRGVGDTPELVTLSDLGGMALTFAIVCVAWVFFRAPTFVDAVAVLTGIATGSFSAAGWQALAAEITTTIGSLLTVPAMASLVAIEWLTRRHPHPLHHLPVPRPVRWAIYTALLWFALAFQGPSGEFIYFQF